MTVPKCLNPECRDEVHVRGLCRNCYYQAIKIVKEKVYTWEELEKLGKVLPSKRGRKNMYGWRRQWLEGKE